MMLFVGMGNPDIKYHASQSTVFFGSLSVVWIILDVVGSLAPLGAIGVINTLLWLFGIVMWIICMVKAWGTGTSAQRQQQIDFDRRQFLLGIFEKTGRFPRGRGESHG